MSDAAAIANHDDVLDVLVIGAGISGIGAAYHLQTMCPGRSFAVLEGRDQIGGTWDLFRYPGVRSDSDMHTLGFGFKPWVHEKSIADGASILEYLNEAVDEFDLRRHIRFGHHVERADWSTKESLWTLTVRIDDVVQHLRCSFLYVCSGYYRYCDGYTPDFPGIDSFAGQVIHPQQWPEDLDVSDKSIAVIGSGATAVTLVPALAETAKHVTMIQRSATYVVARPDTDQVANRLRQALPDKLAYAITRKKNITEGQFRYRATRTNPGRVRDMLLSMVRDELGDELTSEHFTPSYDPWDQRLCLVPNGDLFEAIRRQDASVRSGEIEAITEAGVLLADGELVEADIIVTATGLQLVTLGEINVAIDGEQIDFGDRWTYRGVGYDGVPNLMSTFGYIYASWTLRSDMVNTYVCRLLNHMDAVGATVCTPTLREDDRDMPRRPWIDGFSAGYIARAAAALPKQGDRDPWINYQDYKSDRKSLLKTAIDDGVMRFARR